MSTERAAPGRGEVHAGRVAAVGRAELMAPFQAAGFAVFPVEPGPEAGKRVEELVAGGLSVLFYTEDLYPYIEAVVTRSSREAVPCLVMLPMGAERRGTERLRDIVRRTVGADIFGGDKAERREPSDGTS